MWYRLKKTNNIRIITKTRYAIMSFFDYLYYRIYLFYSGKKSAKSSSAGIVGGFQAANVLTIIMLVLLGLNHKVNINKILVIVIFIILQITSYIRYILLENNSITTIEEKWLSKTELWRKRMKTCLFIYGAVSIISLFGIAIYIGSENSR